MGWKKFKKHTKKNLKKQAHKVTHPKQQLKKIGKDLKRLDKDVTKGAKAVAKVSGKVLKSTDKVITFVEKNAKTIKLVVDITAGVVEAVGVATGQPEIVAAAGALQAGADKALLVMEAARKAQTIAEKARLVAEAIAEKKNIGVIMANVGDVMGEVASVSGNDDLAEMAKHVKTGGKIVDKSIKHAEAAHEIIKGGVEAVKNKDAKAGVKVAVSGVKEGIKVAKTVKQAKKLKKDMGKKPTGIVAKKEKKKIVSPRKESKIQKKTRETTEKVLGKVNKKRAPSKYNIFVGQHIKAGGTFRSAVDAWNKQKGK